MRITEKMGLVYTALFLTVSVAVITQNSDTLMAAFRGDSNIRTVDDIFTVNAGRDQRLFVLQNDVNANLIASEHLKLVSQPACGAVEKTGGSFKYSQSLACSGNQQFAYCVEHGGSCDNARVTLRLVQMRNSVDSIASGPITDLSGLDAQTEINNSGLEITNVHLGRTAPDETTPLPDSGTRLASAAIQTAPILTLARPVPGTGSVSGVFSMSASENFSDVNIPSDQQMVGLSSDGDLPTQTDSLLGEIDLALPIDPVIRMDLGSSRNSRAQTGRRTSVDTGFRAPSVMPGIDASPFGTPCINSVTTTSATGGMVRIQLTAACQPNTRIEISHSKMTFALRVGHAGTLNILVPALEENARFSFILADGTTMKSALHVAGVKQMDRVAVQWSDAFDVNLTAIEFGQRRAVNQGPAGRSLHLGDPTVDHPVQALVYSFERGKRNPSGVIELGLVARATSSVCGGNRVIHSYRSRGGRLVAASGLRFKLPACGDAAQSIVLKNAVRDLIIAAN